MDQLVDTERITARAREIAKAEGERLLQRTPGSAAMHRRALRSLPLGVASSFHANDPYPIYVARGLGSHVWDVDVTSVETGKRVAAGRVTLAVRERRV